jgi:dihydroorotase
MTSISLIRPDDWHIHLRDGDALQNTVDTASLNMGRAIIMPNLVPPVMNTTQALEYRERILEALPAGRQFEPLMVLYLTDNTSAEDIREAAASPYVHACKLYPAGATTNSDSGVTDLANIYAALDVMTEVGMPLLVHGEETDHLIDVFDREKAFIDNKLIPLIKRYPNLKVIMEHITTKDAVDFVMSASDNVAATITVQHLMYNRNHMLVGGIKPHFYCLPILKRNIHQDALRAAATSGNKKFFLGTDSAPHAKDKKEAACGCAGCYTAFAAIELYAEVFEELDALDKLEGFSSQYGPDFYNLPRNTDTITLERAPWTIPATLPLGGDVIVPLKAGETLNWAVK